MFELRFEQEDGTYRRLMCHQVTARADGSLEFTCKPEGIGMHEDVVVTFGPFAVAEAEPPLKGAA